MTGTTAGRPLLRLGLVVTLLAALFVAAGATDAPVYLDTQGRDEALNGTDGSAQRTPITTAALWCPGPEQQGVPDATVSESPQNVVVQGVAAPVDALGDDFADPPPGELTLTAGEAEPLQNDEQAEVLASSLTTADAAEVLAMGGLAPGLSGAQLWLGAQEQAVGLSLTPCRSSVDSAWLLAGGAQPGRAERLVLINPGRAPISVELQVWGVEGVATPDGGTQVALAPGERRVLLLDAVAPSVEAPAVHVEASGGPVTAYLGERWLSGTTDRGWDLSAATTNPARSHVLAGVFGPKARSEDEAGPENDTGLDILRVAVPGPEQAVVRVQALTDEGPVDLPTDVTLLPGQASTDIEIGSLPDGTSAVQVDSDEPVVVSSQLSTRGSTEGRGDIAWVPSADPIGALAGTPLPQVGDDKAPAVAYRLHVAAPLGAQAQVLTVDTGGKVSSAELDVPAGTAREVELAGAQAVWVQTREGEAYAAVSARSLVPVDDADPTARPRREQRTEDADPPAVDEVPVIAVLALMDLPRYRSLVDLVPLRP